MTKKGLGVFILALTLLAAGMANSCVGRIIQIGAIGSPDGMVMAEMLALLVNERTGTTVKIRYYDEPLALYEAVKVQEVGLLVENTTQAMAVLGRPAVENPEQAYNQAKETFRQQFDLVWLDPFKFQNGYPDGALSSSANVISYEVMSDFPGLPRLLNKLAKRIDSADYSTLVQRVKQGEKPRLAARQLLENKKLI